MRSNRSTFSRSGSESGGHPRQPSNVTFTQREDRSRSPRQAVEQDWNITASWQGSIASEGPIAVLTTGPGAGGYSPTDCFRHAARPGCEENFISSEEEEITKPREKTARQHEDLLSSLTDSNQGAGHLQAGESCHRSPGSEESAEERAFLPSSATRTKAGHSSASFAPVKSASHSSTSFASANSSRTKSAYSTGEGESRPSLSEAESFSLEGSREEGQGPEGKRLWQKEKVEVVGQAIQALSQDDWHAALRRVLDSLGAPLSHIGIHVLCLLLHAPAQAGITSRLQLQTWFARAPQLSPINYER